MDYGAAKGILVCLRGSGFVRQGVTSVLITPPFCPSSNLNEQPFENFGRASQRPPQVPQPRRSALAGANTRCNSKT